ncbi:MAG: hypothetical protein K5896_08405 [Prevotella sp.]|jgi:hypothetical protein|nr:hypothetical protein [Prevotella sp.]
MEKKAYSAPAIGIILQDDPLLTPASPNDEMGDGIQLSRRYTRFRYHRDQVWEEDEDYYDE